MKTWSTRRGQTLWEGGLYCPRGCWGTLSPSQGFAIPILEAFRMQTFAQGYTTVSGGSKDSIVGGQPAEATVMTGTLQGPTFKGEAIVPSSHQLKPKEPGRQS